MYLQPSFQTAERPVNSKKLIVVRIGSGAAAGCSSDKMPTSGDSDSEAIAVASPVASEEDPGDCGAGAGDSVEPNEGAGAAACIGVSSKPLRDRQY